MATNTVSITALMKYFTNEHKSVSRGENHLKSGHVMTFSYADGTMMGKVRASMKNKDYDVKIYLDDNLDIKSTTCECPRGVYKCSHAVALFLHALDHLSRTDIECQWKRKRSADEMIKSAEELFPCTSTYEPLSRPVTKQDTDWLFDQLGQSGQFTGLYWLMQPEPCHQANTQLPLVENILKDPKLASVSNSDKEACFFEMMKISKEVILATACLTKGQNSNDAWHLVRKGRLTASNFGPVISARKVSGALIKRLLGGQYLGGVKAVAWGLNHEKEAMNDFSAKLGLTVEDTGVWLDGSGILGASPDGLVGEEAIIEIKCPFSHRTDDLKMCITDKKFCLEFVDNDYHLKKTHPYWHQVQGQLFLTNRKFCYFVIWTLKGCYYIIIEKEEAWGENLDILKIFYKSHIFPHVIGK